MLVEHRLWKGSSRVKEPWFQYQYHFISAVHSGLCTSSIKWENINICLMVLDRLAHLDCICILGTELIVVKKKYGSSQFAPSQNSGPHFAPGGKKIEVGTPKARQQIL